MKTSGFNIPDIFDENKSVDSIFNIEGEKDMEKELRLKKRKRKPDFGFLFPAPKDPKNDMGMGNLCEEKAFEGIL